MRIAFMGSPDFAVPALEALHHAGHAIAAVYCQPPRPAGRGQSVRLCPVHAAAERLGLPVRTPARLRKDLAAQAAFAALGLDAAVVAAYGLILPQAMLDAPRLGCFNIHASLLPRWRGAAPIQAALLAGDSETGITIMQMDAGLDTGAMLLRGTIPIGAHTTATDLHDGLAAMGAALMLRVLAERPAATAQPAEGITYAEKLTRDDGRIDWTRDAAYLDRQVRALNPWPGTFTEYDGTILKILAATPEPHAPEPHAPDSTAPDSIGPGTLLDDALLVRAGRDALRITKLQAPGRAPLDADAFLRGRKMPAGTRLGGPPGS